MTLYNDARIFATVAQSIENHCATPFSQRTASASGRRDWSLLQSPRPGSNTIRHIKLSLLDLHSRFIRHLKIAKHCRSKGSLAEPFIFFLLFLPT